MENIVTVDFDIIMAPSIELYNNSIDQLFYSVDNLADDVNPLIAFCNADLNIYSILTSYLLENFLLMDSKDIHFIFDHDQLYDALEQDKQYNIYNIDHHHDYGYGDRLREDIYCGNWVQMLEKENRLNNYIWITNRSASLLPEGVIGERNLFYEYNLFSIPKPDKIFICASFEWVPFQFHPLFYLWLQFYNTFFDNQKIIEENPRRQEPQD